jgi:hypothetical protein
MYTPAATETASYQLIECQLHFQSHTQLAVNMYTPLHVNPPHPVSVPSTVRTKMQSKSHVLMHNNTSCSIMLSKNQALLARGTHQAQPCAQQILISERNDCCPQHAPTSSDASHQLYWGICCTSLLHTHSLQSVSSNCINLFCPPGDRCESWCAYACSSIHPKTTSFKHTIKAQHLLVQELVSTCSAI